MSRSDEVTEAARVDLDDVSAPLVDMSNPKSSLMAAQAFSNGPGGFELAPLTIDSEKSAFRGSVMTAYGGDDGPQFSERKVSIPTEREIPVGLVKQMADGKLVEFPNGVSGYYDKENNKYHFYIGKGETVTNFQLSKDKTRIERFENYNGLLDRDLAIVREAIGDYGRMKGK